MQAADVMTFGVASIHPEAPIEEAARLMIEQRVSGLPVIDDRGQLIGMITEGDVLRREAGEIGRDRPRWLELVVGRDSAGSWPRLGRLATVAEVMSRPVVSVSEDTTVQDVADILHDRAIKRVPVVRDGKVTGIVSRADLLRGLARLAQDMPTASVQDRFLRQRVLDALAKETSKSWRSVNVVVRNGHVELRGATADASLHQRLVAMVRAVPGVHVLDDRMIVVGPASGRT